MADEAPYFSHFSSFTLDAHGAHVAVEVLYEEIDWLNLTSCSTGESMLVLCTPIHHVPCLAEVLDELNTSGFISKWVEPNGGCVVTYRRATFPKNEPTTLEQKLALEEREGKSLN